VPISTRLSPNQGERAPEERPAATTDNVDACRDDARMRCGKCGYVGTGVRPDGRSGAVRHAMTADLKPQIARQIYTALEPARRHLELLAIS
jgi:hypothetical protein